MDCPPGQKYVAVVERWPLVEVRLYNLPITGLDARPLSYRRLVGDKAIKLGSWDMCGTYMRSGIYVMVYSHFN